MLILLKKNPKYAANVTTHCACLHRLQTIGELVSGDRALVVMHWMLQEPLISNTPPIYGYQKYATANVYQHFQLLMPKFPLALIETL